jgi:predicted DNA-binding transcriptional regulator YafY
MSNKTERIIRLYNRLRRGPVTIDILSKWAKQAGIDISQRQLYRDVSSLLHLQFAKGENVIEFIDEKNRKTWKLEYDDDQNRLSQYDINSFFLFKNFVPTCVQEKRKDSIEKFETILYKQLSKSGYQRLIDANELYLRKTDFYDNFYDIAEQQQIETLIWSLQNKRKLIIEETLVNPSNAKLSKSKFPISFMPMELLFHRGRIHISGIEQETNRLFIFTVDKRFKFDLTNDIYNRAKSLKTYREQLDTRFGISEPTYNKVYNIKIEFTKGYAESMMNFFWHSSQNWKQLKNGNYLLSMRCCIGRELIGWLAQGLDKVKVHQPKALQSLFIAKIQKTKDVYTNNETINEDAANADY